MPEPLVTISNERLTTWRDRLAPHKPRIRIFFNEVRRFAHDPDPADRYLPVFDFYEDLSKPMPDEHLLDRQFERFNVGEDAIAMAYRDKGLRSLSVADLVAINTRFYRCDSCNWTSVSREDVRLVAAVDPRPPIPRRTYR